MKYIIIITILAAAGIAAFLFFHHTHEVWIEETRTFYLNEDFEHIRKIIVRTNVMERLVEANNGQIVAQKWNGISLALDRLRKPNFFAEASGYFDVRIKDRYLGEQVINLQQKAYIWPEKMSLACLLTRPVDKLHQYYSNIIIYKYGSQTRVDLRTGMAVKYTAPKNYDKKAIEASLRKDTQKSLVRVESTMRQIAAEYAGKRIILRIK